MFMVFALVVSTTVETHAMPQKSDVGEQASMSGDCAKHAQAEANKTDQAQSSTGEKPCGDKGMCKCMDGTCHSAAKLIGPSNVYQLSFTSQARPYGFVEESLASELPESIQRPPKA